MTDNLQSKDDDGSLPPVREYNSEELFEDERTIYIRHNEERYLLRITKSGKLILTK